MSAVGRDAGRYEVDHLCVPGGWYSPGYLEIAAAGTIVRVAQERPAGWADRALRRLGGYVVPGMPNLHSHAHQRGLAGRAEGSGRAGREDFWSWRGLMYAFVNRLSPEQFEAIAAQAYVEMLKAGFTAVGEFHYLHNDPDGRAYANPAELAERVLAAAGETGIAPTLLPALYTRGGIGKPPDPGQRRFVLDLDRYLRLVEHLLARQADLPLLGVGLAPHSLRAVDVDELRALVDARDRLDPGLPIHLHVAEQVAEVEECRAGLGATPIRWLLDALPVDGRWTFVHATHGDDAEMREMAVRGVVAGPCPITEANLGDGFFPLREYHTGGGAWGIGTDSNVAIGLAEELRLLEYGQRLLHRRRDVLVVAGDETTEQPGRRLFDAALAGGAKALAQPIGAIAPGKRADLVVLDPDHPALAGQTPRTALDGWVFAAGGGAVRDVMVAGTWVVRDGRHRREDEVGRRFRAALEAAWTMS